MAYNKRLLVLSAIIAALALAYALSVFFESDRQGSRSDAYTWIDPGLTGRIDRISISGSGETKELVLKNNQWFVSYNGKDYPARQMRVEVFISLFTRRAPYPVRSSSSASHERLGLTEDAASRIVISGGAGLPLLDLLVGHGDNTGREVYLRRPGQNEVRSGEDTFVSYISSPRASWYNLRLFPESEDGSLDTDGVQRLSVYVSPGGGVPRPEPQVFTRNGRAWIFGGMNITDADMSKVDSYIRGILTTEGEDFSDSVDPEDPIFNHSRLTLELGDGSVRTIRLSPPDENKRRFALVSGSPYVYALADWAAERLFRDASFFEKQ
jgi:hypothetical protein